MSQSQDIRNSGMSRDDWLDWPHLIEQAAEAILSRLSKLGELSPRQVAETVASTLPSDLGLWLTRHMAELGWLDAESSIPFDVFDGLDCPPDLTGGRRELLRLATFGVPGEGVRSDAKRREAVFQQRCAEIMRETCDLETLSYAASRALSHPEVHADPVLHAMLRTFISEREAEVRVRAQVPGARDEGSPANRHSVPQAPEFRLPLRERVQGTLSKLRLELEGHLTNYNELGAEEVLIRIRDLRKRYPGHVESETVNRCEEQVARLILKRDMFRKQLAELVQQAASAIERGDQKTAAWVLRRLSAIHALLPTVLSEHRLEELRQTILQSGEKQERHEAARNLVQREQSVGAEIKRLGAIIHRYHKLSKNEDVDPKVMQQAETAYHSAVQEVRSHDDEWLADLMIELDCLLEDLHGPRDRAEAQVDKFVNNVRLAVSNMRAEIEQIQSERAASSQE